MSRFDDVHNPALETEPPQTASPESIALEPSVGDRFDEALADAVASEPTSESVLVADPANNPASLSADQILQATDAFLSAQQLQIVRLRQQIKADRLESLATQGQYEAQLTSLNQIIQVQQQRIRELEQRDLTSRSAVITEEVATQEAQLQVKRLQDTIQQRRRMITALENQLEETRQDLRAQQSLTQAQTQTIVTLQQELAQRKTDRPQPKQPPDNLDLAEPTIRERQRIRELETQVRQLQAQIAQLPAEMVPAGMADSPSTSEDSPVTERPKPAPAPPAQPPDAPILPSQRTNVPDSTSNNVPDSTSNNAINPGPMLRALPPLVRQPRLRVLPEPQRELPPDLDTSPEPEPDTLDWVQGESRANELKALKVELKLPTFLERREIPDECPQSDDPDNRLPSD